MKQKFLMTMAAATMILAGCSNDENETIDNWNGEIRLTSGVTVQTRAMYGLDEKIKDGREVHVWVDDHAATPDKKQLYSNNSLTVDNRGALNGTAMYYPQTGANVDIYAIHTNDGAISGEDFPKTAITHAVAIDQSDAGKYAPCDLLYAIKKDQSRQADAVELTFHHLLSKVEVALKAGSGLQASDLSGATVTIENTKLKADFTPTKDADINNSDAETARVAGGKLVKPTDTNNDAAPITIATTVTTNDFGEGTDYGEAIVVPQTVTQNATFIKVTLTTGGVLTYKIDDALGLTLESGKKYIFKITVNLSSLSVSSIVASWGTGSEKAGEANM